MVLKGRDYLEYLVLNRRMALNRISDNKVCRNITAVSLRNNIVWDIRLYSTAGTSSVDFYWCLEGTYWLHPEGRRQAEEARSKREEPFLIACFPLASSLVCLQHWMWAEHIPSEYRNVLTTRRCIPKEVPISFAVVLWFVADRLISWFCCVVSYASP
jgi:hypothetical protein